MFIKMLGTFPSGNFTWEIVPWEVAIGKMLNTYMNHPVCLSLYESPCMFISIESPCMYI